MMTFKDVQDRVLRWIDEAGDTSTTLTNVKDAINACHRTICFKDDWPWMMWPREESFTTTAGVKQYALNPSLGKLRTLWDVTTNDWAIILPRRQWESQGVDRSLQQRSPSRWVFGPVWPVRAQPSTADTVSIVSTRTTDKVTQQVNIIGIDRDFVEQNETITANRTVPVFRVNQFTQILSVSKIGTWTGTMTLRDHAGNQLLRLDPNEYGQLFPTIESTENPYAGRQYLYTFLRKPRYLTNDYDIPEIHPNDLREVLVYGALLELTTYNTELGQKEQVFWQKRYDELLKGIEDANDEAILGRMPRTVRDVDLRNRVRWVRTT